MSYMQISSVGIDRIGQVFPQSNEVKPQSVAALKLDAFIDRTKQQIARGILPEWVGRERINNAINNYLRIVPNPNSDEAMKYRKMLQDNDRVLLELAPWRASFGTKVDQPTDASGDLSVLSRTTPKTRADLLAGFVAGAKIARNLNDPEVTRAYSQQLFKVVAQGMPNGQERVHVNQALRDLFNADNGGELGDAGQKALFSAARLLAQPLGVTSADAVNTALWSAAANPNSAVSQHVVPMFTPETADAQLARLGRFAATGELTTLKGEPMPDADKAKFLAAVQQIGTGLLMAGRLGAATKEDVQLGVALLLQVEQAQRSMAKDNAASS